MPSRRQQLFRYLEQATTASQRSLEHLAQLWFVFYEQNEIYVGRYDEQLAYLNSVMSMLDLIIEELTNASPILFD